MRRIYVRNNAFVATAALLGAMFVPAVDSISAQASTPSSARTTFIVRGAVLDADGSPVGNAPVVISAWPDSESLAIQQEGSKVPMTTLKTISTNANGDFSAEIELVGAELLALREKDELNLQAKSIVGNTVYLAEFTVSDFELSGERRKVKSANVGVLKHAGQMSVKMHGERAIGGCGYMYYLNDVGSAYATVGSTFMSASQGSAQFTFATGATTTLGVAFSTSSGLSVGGSNSVSSESTIIFPANTSNVGRNHQVSFTLARYALTCSSSTQIRAKSFAGGSRTISAWTPSATYCEEFVAGGQFLKSSTVASTNSVGFDTSGLIGIDLSSRSGFTTTSRIQFRNTSSTPKKICGVYAAPGLSAGKLVMKD